MPSCHTLPNSVINVTARPSVRIHRALPRERGKAEQLPLGGTFRLAAMDHASPGPDILRMFEFRRAGDSGVEDQMSRDFPAASVGYTDDNPNRRFFVRPD
jgi:hypothetical protein